jgi:hypothetical protein
MFRCLTRFIVLVVVLILAILFFATTYIGQAGHSLLNAFNNSAASGYAQYIPSNPNNQTNYLQVSASNLDHNGTYHITLDNNGCKNAPVVDVGDAVADGSGNINQTFPVQKFDTSQIWFIDIHQGVDSAGPTVACGQLVINSNASDVQSTPFISMSPASNGQVSPPTIPGVTPTPAATPETGFPNTGVRPGDKNHYDNYVYPRKY